MKQTRRDKMGVKGRIQWKGTDVCVDITCECGCKSHFDGFNMYYVKCPECGKVYEAQNKISFEEVKTINQNKPAPRKIDKW